MFIQISLSSTRNCSAIESQLKQSHQLEQAVNTEFPQIRFHFLPKVRQGLIHFGMQATSTVSYNRVIGKVFEHIGVFVSVLKFLLLIVFSFP